MQRITLASIHDQTNMNGQKIESALVDLLADQVKQTTYAGSALIALVGAALWISFPRAQILSLIHI